VTTMDRKKLLGIRTAQVTRYQQGQGQPAVDMVAEEVPVAMVYNGISHAVMMATPSNLKDFAMGFSFTEGIIKNGDDLRDVQVNKMPDGIELNMKVSERTFQNLKATRRNLTGATGCGLCGLESLKQVVKLPPPLKTRTKINPQVIEKVLQKINRKQLINSQTGAVHAAAWVSETGDIFLLREDVGRHNALDKLIGALSNKERPTGFLLVTSRASYEMILKAGWAGMDLIVAISAPTSLAIKIAKKLNISLVGFARDDQYVVYT